MLQDILLIMSFKLDRQMSVVTPTVNKEGVGVR